MQESGEIGSKPHVLLVDDKLTITNNLASFLDRAGFAVRIAHDGEAALVEMKRSPPDLVVLDVLMPRLDGRSVLRQLRKGNNWTPVILLTQVGEAVERAMALDEGADDYLTKPFDPYELAARIRAVLRRVQPNQPPLAVAHRLQSLELVVDRRAQRGTLAGNTLELTPKALALLVYLITHPDELLTRERLLDAVWGWEYPAATRTVDTRIAELRRALQDDAANPRYIETVSGQGYRFIAPVEAAS